MAGRRQQLARLSPAALAALGASSHPLSDLSSCSSSVCSSLSDDAELVAAAAAPAGASPPRAASRASPPPPPSKPIRWSTRLADRATAAVQLEAHYKLPPQLLFELLADPSQHERIFDEILAADAELLEDDGAGRRKFRLDYTARWSFWRVAGVCENRLFMWTDRDQGIVSFKLREPGFLNKYEGVWRIAAGCGTPLSACAAGSTLSLSSSGSGGSSRAASPGSPRASPASGRLAPLASVTLGGAGSSPGQALEAAGSGLTGAVAAIARMQAEAQASLSSSLSSLGSSLGRLTSPAAAWAAGQELLGGGGGSRAGSGSGSDAGSGRPQLARPTTSIITAHTLTSPRLTPPFPLNKILKTQAKGQVEDMLDGLIKAAAAQLAAEPLEPL